MKPTLASRVTISPEVLCQELQGEAVLLDLAGGCYFGLDDVGTRAWQLLGQHGMLRAVYDVMLDEFDVEPRRLENDLLAHVAELVDAGLVILDAEHAPTP